MLIILFYFMGKRDSNQDYMVTNSHIEDKATPRPN